MLPHRKKAITQKKNASCYSSYTSIVTAWCLQHGKIIKSCFTR